MNRRSFFKTVTGFVAGVYATCVPKAKVEEWDFEVAPYDGRGNSDGVDLSPSYYMLRYDENGNLTDDWIASKEDGLKF